MNNIVSKLKNIWQYLANNPNTTPELKERFTALATKAKGMLAPKKQPEAGVSPRQAVLNALGKAKAGYNAGGQQTPAQKTRETKTPYTTEELQRQDIQKDYTKKALTSF